MRLLKILYTKEELRKKYWLPLFGLGFGAFLLLGLVGALVHNAAVLLLIIPAVFFIPRPLVKRLFRERHDKLVQYFKDNPGERDRALNWKNNL